MALTYVAGPAKQTGTGTTLTATSTTYPAGALLVVALAQNGNFSADTGVNPGVVSGLSLTWTLRVAQDWGTNGATVQGASRIWTAVVGAGGVTGTITGTWPFGGTNREKFMQVSYFTDTSAPTPGVTGTASGTTSLPSVALTGLTVGSFVVAVTSDWSASGTSATCTPGTGQTDISDDWVSTQYGAHYWRTTSAIAGTTQTMNLTAPTGETFNLSALEVKAAGTAATPAPPRLRMQNRAALIRASSL